MLDRTRLSETRERTLSALAHASGLLLGVGHLAPLVLWINERKKSAALELHALQALAFQLLQTAWWGLPPLLALVVGLLYYASGHPKAINALSLVIPILILAGGAFHAAGCLLAAGSVLAGFNFRYLIVGNLIHALLTAQAEDEKVEADAATPGERVMAALCHAAVVHPLGIALPLGVWASQRRRSPFLGAQAIQAAVHQGLLWFLIMVFVLLATLPWVMLALASRRGGGGEAWGILAFAEGMVVIIGFPLIVLTFLVFLAVGLWAAVRVARGRDFRYPILGWIAARQKAQSRASS